MTRLPGPRLWQQGRWAWRLQRDPAEALHALAGAYGSVAAIGVGPLRYVFLFGLDAVGDLFTSDTDRFSWLGATKSLLPVDGETALIVSDGEDHRRRRRIVQPAFNVRRIESHVPLMAEEATRTIASWTAGDELDAYEHLRATVRRIVMQALFGKRLSGLADELGERLQPALDFVNLPVPLQVKVGPRWAKAREARRRTDALVYAELAERRRTGYEGDDVLTWLLQSQDEGGLSDQEVRDQVVSLVAAGYDTTSAAVGWALWAARFHAGVWEQLRAEVAAVLGEEALTAEALRRMPYLGAVVNESLRLWPPAIAAGRQAVQPLEVAGHVIPPGALVMYSPYVTHRLAEAWREPLSFSPERWLVDRPGHVEPPPLAFLPFGAGPRRCIGFAFALMEIKVVLAEVVRRVDLELVAATHPGRAGLASMRPKAGVRVRVRAVRTPGTRPVPGPSPGARSSRGPSRPAPGRARGDR
ncbi:MAG: hypothetical protein JWP02_142 [Acidimicrobiales bacterium]|nr:hypothetical protein [Acidimicrobiales bacterium]